MTTETDKEALNWVFKVYLSYISSVPIQDTGILKLLYILIYDIKIHLCPASRNLQVNNGKLEDRKLSTNLLIHKTGNH
jgi:hypothetical protein